MIHQSSFNLVIILISFISFVDLIDYKNLKKPTKLSNCKAELDDKTIIDLSSLNNKNNPR